MYPIETETTPATYNPKRVLKNAKEAKKDVHSFSSNLEHAENSIWIAFESISYSKLSGTVEVPTQDAYLLSELKNAGYLDVSFADSKAPGIIQMKIKK